PGRGVRPEVLQGTGENHRGGHFGDNKSFAKLPLAGKRQRIGQRDRAGSDQYRRPGPAPCRPAQRISRNRLSLWAANPRTRGTAVYSEGTERDRLENRGAEGSGADFRT